MNIENFDQEFRKEFLRLGNNNSIEEAEKSFIEFFGVSPNPLKRVFLGKGKSNPLSIKEIKDMLKALALANEENVEEITQKILEQPIYHSKFVKERKNNREKFVLKYLGDMAYWTGNKTEIRKTKYDMGSEMATLFSEREHRELIFPAAHFRIHAMENINLGYIDLAHKIYEKGIEQNVFKGFSISDSIKIKGMNEARIMKILKNIETDEIKNQEEYKNSLNLSKAVKQSPLYIDGTIIHTFLNKTERCSLKELEQGIQEGKIKNLENIISYDPACYLDTFSYKLQKGMEISEQQENYIKCGILPYLKTVEKRFKTVNNR